jgi:hypothetical protein
MAGGSGAFDGKDLKHVTDQIGNDIGDIGGVGGGGIADGTEPDVTRFRW